MKLYHAALIVLIVSVASLMAWCGLLFDPTANVNPGVAWVFITLHLLAGALAYAMLALLANRDE